MKKVLLGLLLVVAMVAVSCSQDSVVQDELISIRFTKLQAKAIDETVYTVEKDATWGGANVQIGNVGDYFWTYKATKIDSTFKTGQTDDFVNWSDNMGLSGSKEFSSGSWKFELKAYASKTDRDSCKTEDKAIFKGEVTTEKLTSKTTVSVPMSFTYVSGQGTVNFTITATITQPELSTSTITKIEMVINEKTVTLTKGETNWTGSDATIASGKQKVEIKVYVDNDTNPTVSKEIGNAYILHGLTTNVTGSATITLTGDKEVEVSFNPNIPVLPTKAPAGTKVGDTLTLGTLPNSETSVTWKVLAVQDKKALVISEKSLKLMAHTNSETDTYSWANSKINTWLNDTTDNGFVSQYGLDNVSIVAGNSEVGKVFILSYAEATTYNCTADVTYVGDTENEAGEYGWWLRDAGTEPNQAMQILMNTMQGIMGNTMDNGANNELGVRPAFWIDIK